MRQTILICVLALGTYLNAAELPVRQVILYKHGVGYFQRSGDLRAGESARLDFNASDMNDVLKSLTIVEKGGGKVSGLRYDSSEPLEKKLANYPFRLAGSQALSAVLDELKGAAIELKFGNDTVRGAILSGRVLPGDEKRPEVQQLSLLLDSGELRVIDLAGASVIRLVDPALQAQFKDYLADLVGARSKEKRSVYIDSTGSQNRQLTAEYIVPMPVWKSSYRLIWDTSAEPTLEGWAIVDNTTGEDWSGVQLSLVSGRPISFISRLYDARYISRPTAELPEDRPQAPVVYQGALDALKKDEGAANEMRAERQDAKQMAFGVAGGMVNAPAAMAKAARMVATEAADVSSTLASTAAGQELGELFEYRFPNNITVRKSESAMLPFLQQKLTARKLLIYSDPSSVHPLNSTEITNSSGKTLDGGPITVYEEGAYAGEALMETLKTGDKRLISYGVDLGTRVSTQFDSKGEIVREVHLRRGMMTTRTAAVETKTFTVKNVDQKPKTLIIEHPVRPEYKLINQKPLETTANAYRFEIKLAASATEKFPVTEERVFENSTTISNLTPDVLISYIQNKNLSDATHAQLQQILDLKRQIVGADAEARRADEQISKIFQDQERLRQNINSLRSVPGQEQQVQTYSRQLAAQETQLATLRDQTAAQRKKKSDLETQLGALIEKMEF